MWKSLTPSRRLSALSGVGSQVWNPARFLPAGTGPHLVASLRELCQLLGKLDPQNLHLSSGESRGLNGIAVAGSSQPRETKHGLLQEVIDKSNQLYAGTDVDEVAGVSVTETIVRHLVQEEKIRARP